MEITNKDLSQMSPEQVAAMQKQNCIFCHIIDGKVSSKKVFEDDVCIAILDINPANPGHVLILPKEHYTILPLIPEDIVMHMGQVAKHISRACLSAMKCQGTNLFIANGVVAGQKAPHFMIHVIPRRDGDDIGVFNLSRNKMNPGDLDNMQKKLTEAACEVLKVAPPKKRYAKEEAHHLEHEPEEEGETIEADVGAPAEKTEVKMPFSERQPLPKVNIDELTKAILSQPAITKPSNETTPDHDGGEVFIASTQSNRVHAKNCPLAKKIKEENLIKFNDKKKALLEGYEECDCLK